MKMVSGVIILLHFKFIFHPHGGQPGGHTEFTDYFLLVFFMEFRRFELNRRKEKEERRILELENETKNRRTGTSPKAAAFNASQRNSLLTKFGYCCVYENCY